MPMLEQIYSTILLSFVTASIAWTVTQEAIFEEWRNSAKERSESAANIFARKFFYVWTCEYCFSHWVTIGLLLLTDFRLLIDDWRGYLIAFFVITWIANQWMSLYRRLRVAVKKENTIAELAKEDLQERR
jgi:hypothetical protein